MTFDDLLQAYRTSPAELFKQLDSLNAQQRRDLLVDNVERRLHSNRVEEEDQIALLPREYRRLAGVRWDHFGYVLHYFEPSMMEHQLKGHLEIEAEDEKATYMRNMLAMLVWMSVDHEGADEAGAAAASTRSEKRKSRRS